MSTSRRSFLSHSAAFGILSTLAVGSELAEAIDRESAKSATSSTAGETYWRTLYSGTSGQTRGGLKTPNNSRDPRMAYWSDTKGMIWAEDIRTEDLPKFDDDAVVTLELSGFRCGSRDKANLAKVRFAQLHLSCQRVTGSAFLGPLVWASLATLFTQKANKLPQEQNLTWSSFTRDPMQPSQSRSDAPRLTHVVLNQGSGRMSVNVTTTPTNSILDKVLGGLINGTKILSPLLGFPGIALPALENFYTFYGQLEKSRPENFLLNTAKMDVAVTQQGKDSSLISANALKLIAGSYILVPNVQEDAFQKDMDKLVVNNGYLVDRDSKADPDRRIEEAIPDVSYVTLSVKVQKASDFPATSTVTDPMLDSPPIDNSATKKKKKD